MLSVVITETATLMCLHYVKKDNMYGHVDMLSAILSAVITQNTLTCVQCKLMLVLWMSFSPHMLLHLMCLFWF